MAGNREKAIENLEKAHEARKGQPPHNKGLKIRSDFGTKFVEALLERYGGLEEAVKAMPEADAWALISKTAHEYVKKSAGTAGITGDDLARAITSGCTGILDRIKQRQAVEVQAVEPPAIEPGYSHGEQTAPVAPCESKQDCTEDKESIQNAE